MYNGKSYLKAWLVAGESYIGCTTTQPLRLKKTFILSSLPSLKRLCIEVFGEQSAQKFLINRENEMKIDLAGAHASANKSAEIYKTE